MQTMDQMSNVMAGMAKIMGNAQNKMSLDQFQNNMKTYTTEKERMELVNEMIQDSMDMAEDDIDDTDVDGLIANMEADLKNKKLKQQEADLEAPEGEPL
jgi:division protein CdvB (Snf7/Vps24/ESCRT-III family)